MNRYEKIDKIVCYVFKLMAYIVAFLLAVIIYFVFKEGVDFFKTGNVLSVFTSSWKPLSTAPSFGLIPMILGTVYIGFLSAIIALPVAIGSALFISNYIKGKFKYLTLSIIDLLAGIPSVVYGLLGLFTVVKFLENNTSLTTGESIIAAVLTLNVMIIPFMLSSYVKAFDDINKRFFLQTQALGTSSWYSLSHLSISAAKGHILTGFLLALSRALGETMAVMMVVGNSPILPKLFGKGITLSGLIALEMSGSQLGSLHYKSLYIAGSILMVLLLMVNYIVRKIDKKVKDNEV